MLFLSTLSYNSESDFVLMLSEQTPGQQLVVNVCGGHSICHQVTCCCYVTRRPDGTSDPDTCPFVYKKWEEEIEQREPQEQLERAVVRVICGFGLVSAEFLEYQVLTGLSSRCHLGCLRLTIWNVCWQTEEQPVVFICSVKQSLCFNYLSQSAKHRFAPSLAGLSKQVHRHASFKGSLYAECSVRGKRSHIYCQEFACTMCGITPT